MCTLIYITLLMFCTACTHECSSVTEVPVANDIMRSHDRKLAKMGLYRCMTSGPICAPIREISAGYATNSFRFTSIDEARKFFLRFYSEYSKPFMESDSIRYYLNEYPLESKNFYLFIFFYDEKREIVVAPYITSISLSNGKICYDTYDEDGGKGSYILLEETFEEAMEKLAAQGEAEELKNEQ